MRLQILFLVFIFATPRVWAGEVRPMDSVLKSRPTANESMVIEFCELGSCQVLGRAAGYTREQWRAIQNVCREEGQYSQAKAIGAQVLGFMGVHAIWNLYGASLAVFAIQVLSLDPVSDEAKIFVGDTLGGILADDQNFVLSIRDFINLIDGIKSCAETWEWHQHPLYKRYNNGYARPLP